MKLVRGPEMQGTSHLSLCSLHWLAHASCSNCHTIYFPETLIPSPTQSIFSWHLTCDQGMNQRLLGIPNLSCIQFSEAILFSSLSSHGVSPCVWSPDVQLKLQIFVSLWLPTYSTSSTNACSGNNHLFIYKVHS